MQDRITSEDGSGDVQNGDVFVGGGDRGGSKSISTNVGYTVV